MPLIQRKPPLPEHLHDAWWAFVDCAEVIEGARRILLGTMPTGRVEPAPVAVGIEAVRGALRDARSWMGRWKIDRSESEELLADWQDCHDAMDEADSALDQLSEVAASTTELEELLSATEEVVAPLDAFADAERTWRRTWKVPRQR